MPQTDDHGLLEGELIMPTKTAIVTGASGGLGSEICKLIAARGV